MSFRQHNGATPRLGVTPPVSEAMPTQTDLALTESLLQTLKDEGLFESDEESKIREIVLGKLDKMVKEFVYKVCLRRNVPEAIAREAGGKIFTFGSYRLGVHGSGTDIDTLCVVPKHVFREDFFQDMYEMLKARSEVTELAAVPDAFTPVIGMKFSGIPIDFTFARLGLNTIPDSLDLMDDKLLTNLDDRCIRSVNGSRVTDDILRLVPNIPSFRMALRCVKLWAKRRAVYSNMMGFFGGVQWAMLVARVCQLYPNACAATIISRFFNICYQWPWPQPVLLKHMEEGALQVRVWNPKLYPSDKSHRMPIITPAYPSMCSTHNVTDSTKSVMLSEFKDAAEIMTQIMGGKLPWSALFIKDDFFSRYRHYLQVIASSDSEEKHLRWSGLVESRMRHLVMKLERIENLILAHPYTKGFAKVCQYRTNQEKEDAAHGKFPTPTEAEALESAEKGEVHTMYTTTFYIGLSIPPRDASQTATRKLDLYRPKEEFTEMVQSWDKFDKQSMAVVVQHIRSASLPSDIIQDADAKKTKRSKSGKVKAAATPPTKKRRASNSMLNAPNGSNNSSNGSLNGVTQDHSTTSTPDLAAGATTTSPFSPSAATGGGGVPGLSPSHSAGNSATSLNNLVGTESSPILPQA